MQDEVNDINSKNVRGNTRDGYLNCLVHLLEWIKLNKPEVLHTSFRDSAINKPLLETFLKQRNCPLLNLAQLDVHTVRLFITSRKSEEDTYFSFTYYKQYRSAIMFLFKTFEHVCPPTFTSGLKTFFAGLKRTVTDQKEQGKSKLVEGKRELPFELYCKLGLRLMQIGGKDQKWELAYFSFFYGILCAVRITVPL